MSSDKKLPMEITPSGGSFPWVYYYEYAIFIKTWKFQALDESSMDFKHSLENSQRNAAQNIWASSDNNNLE